MKKSVAVLMDAILIFLLIFLSTNYPGSSPHYNPNTYRETKAGNPEWENFNSNTMEPSDMDRLRPKSIDIVIV